MNNHEDDRLADLCVALQETARLDRDIQANALAVSRAEADVTDKEARVERFVAERSAFIDREARRQRRAIETGRTSPACVTDARVAVERDGAVVSLEAAMQVREELRQEGSDLRAARAAAERRISAIRLALHRAHVAELIQQRRAARAEYLRLTALAGFPKYAGELMGLRDSFVGAVDDVTLAELQAPVPRMDVADLFFGKRAVVDINTPIGAAPDAHMEALQYWRAYDARLAQLAAAQAAERAA